MISLSDENLSPVVLFFFLTKKYGHEWMSWAPDPLRHTLETDFKTTVAKKNLNRALAMAVLATRDTFFDSWEAFHFLVPALIVGVPSADTMQEHTVGEMMAAVDDALYLRTHLDTLVPVPKFAETVARYVAAHAKNQGVWYLPEPLAFAADYSAGKKYRCKDCGNEGEVLFDDGLCDTCVHRFDTETLGAWRPDPEAMARGLGRNTELFFENPPQGAQARFLLLTRDPAQYTGSQDDVCAAKLVEALDYVNARRMLRDRALKGIS